MDYLQKIIGWYFTKRALPYWCVLVLDCLIVGVSGILGCYRELGGMLVVGKFWPIVLGLICGMPMYALSFHLFHTYQGIIRYSSYVDLFRIAKATVLGSVLSYVLGICIGWFVDDAVIAFPDIHASVISLGISTLGIWIVRMAVKASYEVYRIDKAIPVAIYGTQAGGISLAKVSRRNNFVCIIDILHSQPYSHIVRDFIMGNECGKII